MGRRRPLHTMRTEECSPPMKRCNELALAGLLAAAGAVQAQELDPSLMALAQQETPAVLETLRALTAPDSGTGQAAGMAAVADVIERFAGDLGGQVQRLAPANGVAGPNLVITFKGTGKRRIMLMSHMDTVYPAGTAAARPLRVDGNRAIAPGIADDKGGIAVFLHAMKLLKARGFQDYERVTMVFNSDEERGSGGSRELIRSQAQAHDAVLSGEPTSASPEGIVLGTSGVAQLSARVRVGGPFGSAGERPIEELADLVLRTREVQQQVAETRMNWTVMRAEDGGTLHKLPADQWQFSTLRFHVKGRASHAGVAPAAGINAVVETAAVVKRAGEAAARFPDVRVHWRLASGGLVPNIIPDRGQAVAEVAVPKGSDPAPVLEALSRAGTQNMLAGAQVEAQGMPGLGERPSGSGEALASADIRIPNQEAFQQIGRAAREKIEQKKFAPSAITVQDAYNFPAYNASAEGQQLAQVAQRIDRQLGGRLEIFARTYGGTDAVWASQSGKPVVESMGLPGGNYHSSDEEYVLLDRIPRRLALVAELIRHIARQGP